MRAQLHSRQDLSSAHIEEMFALFNRHFEGITRSLFHADLEAKNWVLLMTGEDGRLIGFTTLDFQVSTFRGEKESVLYSGDTIMDPEAWNSSILARSFVEAAFNLHDRYGCGPLWWLLITSGFRTYRLLPVFMRQFFPCCDAEPPEYIRERLSTLAKERFGSRFSPASGIVRFEHPQHLREHLHGIPSTRLQNRHVAFFNKLNPGHIDGDELVSLTRLEPSNLSSAGRRMLESIRREPVLSSPLP